MLLISFMETDFKWLNARYEREYLFAEKK